MLHVPILRRGRPYRSLEVALARHHRTGEPVAELSQANPGLIRRDLLDQQAMRRRLAERACRELVALTVRAAGHFANDTLQVGDQAQTPEDYVRQVSATTGLPWPLVRRNLRRIGGVLAGVEGMLSGLTRGLDLALLDRGMGESAGHALSYVPRCSALGVVLPSNSPGVHSLWAPALALKAALVLKPGGAEPWTPFRLVQAFLAAGAPEEAFGYYPTDHAGAAEILLRCGRGMVFGDSSTTSRWRSDPRVEVHGPGYSKVLLGPDASAGFERHLDVIESSIAENSGRSCINASGVWVSARAEEVAEALAARLLRIEPLPAEDEAARLAPFAEAGVAARISRLIDEGLAVPGARDVTAGHRGGGRLVSAHGCTYLLPTVVLCDGPSHPLANREFLFPFASVVRVREEQIPEALGETLALTAITEDSRLLDRLLASPLIHRLSVGPIPTWQVSWDQPHEGNLFEHLYARRALQRSASA